MSPLERDPWSELSSQAETRSRPGEQLPAGPTEPGTARLSGLIAGAAEALRDRYLLQEELGRGAAGAVYRAREVTTGREVALKLLLGERLDERRRTRFQREAELTAALDHPGIVKVHAAGEAGGQPWIAYELLPGRTLREVLPAAPRAERVALVRDVARALGHAHARGVIHRDVKPENVLVGQDGRARVADFGLAAARGLAPLTRSGAILGTPAWMAPEQAAARREELGPPTDVWAVGVMLYAALTDELPFQGGTMLQLAAAIEQASPVWPRALDPTVPPALEAIVRRALARHPAERYPHGEALARDLDAWLSGTPVSRSGGSALRAATRRARRAWPLLLGAGALSLAGAALLLAPGGEEVAAPGPPRVTLAPLAPGPVLHARLGLEGQVEGSGPWFVVRVGREKVRAVAGRPFRLEVPLEPGANRLVLQVSDAEGREGAPLRLEVERVVVPPWFAALDPARRPPLPLPAGLVADPTRAGEYEARDGSRLAWIAPGRFHMGSPETPSEAPEPEHPPREVTLTAGFFLGQHELTWGRWRAWCNQTGHPLRPPPFAAGADHPVVDVTWSEARAYCAWAGLRLPSEAEWEWAARGTRGRTFPWGEERPDGGRANLATGDMWEYTAPAGSFPRGATPEGVQDLIGNVSEWVEDYFAPYPPGPAQDPRGPREGGLNPAEPTLGAWRVFRGSDWKTSTYLPRAAVRGKAGEEYRSAFLGFRVAR